MHLSGLFIYPVKSLRGFSVTHTQVDELGLVGDRRFLVVDENGKFLTQRTVPRMATIATALGAESLVLSADGHGQCHVPRRENGGEKTEAALRSVSIWKSGGLLAEDCGDATANWLGDILGLRCRLVRIGEKFRRPVLKPAAGPGDLVSFADSVPFLVLSEASVAVLNDRLAARGEPAVPMNRFRPNLVIAGAAPHAEDTWSRLQIGAIVFHAAGPCARCIMTTTDQLTGEREGPEPLRTLATYRRSASDPSDVDFGQNLIHQTKSGTLRIGDAVKV